MDLADLLFERCREAARSWPKGLAEIFELLIWATDDNGSEIMRAVERWLQSDDLDRVRIAVEVQEVFPFRHRAEMEAVLALVKARWPELADPCDRLSRARTECDRDVASLPPDIESRVRRLQDLLRQVLA